MALEVTQDLHPGGAALKNIDFRDTICQRQRWQANASALSECHSLFAPFGMLF